MGAGQGVFAGMPVSSRTVMKLRDPCEVTEGSSLLPSLWGTAGRGGDR